MIIAKDQNAFAKRARQMEKKRKAEEKRKRGKERKAATESASPQDSSGDEPLAQTPIEDSPADANE